MSNVINETEALLQELLPTANCMKERSSHSKTSAIRSPLKSKIHATSLLHTQKRLEWINSSISQQRNIASSTKKINRFSTKVTLPKQVKKEFSHWLKIPKKSHSTILRAKRATYTFFYLNFRSGCLKEIGNSRDFSLEKSAKIVKIVWICTNRHLVIFCETFEF